MSLTHQHLVKAIESLPSEVLPELVNFIEYLRYKTLYSNDESEINLDLPQLEQRPYGLCAGEFIVPDDFDDPLPEEIIKEFEGL